MTSMCLLNCSTLQDSTAATDGIFGNNTYLSIRPICSRSLYRIIQFTMVIKRDDAAMCCTDVRIERSTKGPSARGYVSSSISL